MSRQLFEEARKVLTQEAAVKLDPVGQEDKDVDNDGDADKTDSYLKKRRGAISAAIAKSKNESTLSDEDLAKLQAILGEMKKKEEMEDEEDDEKEMKKEKMAEGAIEDAEAAKKKMQIPAAARKAQGGNWKVTQQDLEKMPAATRTTSQGLAAHAKRIGIGEEAELEEGMGLYTHYVVKHPKTGKIVHHEVEKNTSGSSEMDSRYSLRVRYPKHKIISMDHQDKNLDPSMVKEEADSVDEAKLNPAGKAAVRNVTKKIGAKTLSQTKAIVALAKMDPKKVKEEAEQEDFELIEKLNFEVPQNPSYQDYVKAALTIAECKSFSELSEEDQQYIMSEMEAAFKANNIDFIIESEALADMNDTVQRLRKAGHKIEDMGRDFKGNPFYVYVDKGSGMRRKVLYKGGQKVTQNMGRAQPEKEEDNQ